jgi:hypothetical protein
VYKLPTLLENALPKAPLRPRYKWKERVPACLSQLSIAERSKVALHEKNASLKIYIKTRQYDTKLK